MIALRPGYKHILYRCVHMCKRTSKIFHLAKIGHLVDLIACWKTLNSMKPT